MDRIFEREEWLIGKDALDKLVGARVALFGVGGVGSYAAEALARGGVGHIELIDNDTVSVTNINRQLCALVSTVGRPKVSVVQQAALLQVLLLWFPPPDPVHPEVLGVSLPLPHYHWNVRLR